MRLRAHVLGALKRHTLLDPLLHSSVIHPQLFAPEVLPVAATFLKTAFDANTVRDHAGWVSFKALAWQHLPRQFSPCNTARFGASDARCWLLPPSSVKPSLFRRRSREGLASNALVLEYGTDVVPNPQTVVWLWLSRVFFVRNLHWRLLTNPAIVSRSGGGGVVWCCQLVGASESGKCWFKSNA